MGNNPIGPKNPAGRPKGAQNKATIEIKEAFRNLIELNTPNMIGWLERVAAENPAKALELCGSLAEFIVPKLARTEHTGDKDNPVRLTFGWENDK